MCTQTNDEQLAPPQILFSRTEAMKTEAEMAKEPNAGRTGVNPVHGKEQQSGPIQKFTAPS